jgi:hypothetical protein
MKLTRNNAATTQNDGEDRVAARRAAKTTNNPKVAATSAL